MKMRFVVATAFCSLASSLSFAAEKTPTAVDLLFNVKHLDNVTASKVLTYRFERKVSSQKIAGEAFGDDIKVTVAKMAPDGSKNVVLAVFTGGRARSPFMTPGMTGNPLLLWYLNRAVSSYSILAGGSTNYLKSKFSTAIGKVAEVEPVKIDLDGKQVDGYKIKLTPYLYDPGKIRMQGFEISSFEVLVSDQVPGFFYDMVSKLKSTGKGAPTVEERITFKSVGDSE